MSELLALDISSNRMGVAEGLPTFGTRPRLYHVKLKTNESQTREDVWRNALIWTVDRLKVSKPCRVVIEAPIEPTGSRERTNANAVVMLWGLYATISSVVAAKNIPFRAVAVSTVRKHFIGKGNLPGDEAKRHVRRRCEQLGWDAKNYDESDAAAVWDWGVAQLNPLQKRLQGV